MIPPTTTAMSPASCARNPSTTRRASRRWAPESTERPTTSTSSWIASRTISSGVRLSPEYTTSTPASRSACATTFAPRSWPSSPGFAIKTFTLTGSARPARSFQELEDAAPHAPVFDGESSHRHRQFETAGAGASRIEKQHAVALLLERLVTVTGDDRAEPRRVGVEVERTRGVPHVQPHAS